MSRLSVVEASGRGNVGTARDAAKQVAEKRIGRGSHGSQEEKMKRGRIACNSDEFFKMKRNDKK